MADDKDPLAPAATRIAARIALASMGALLASMALAQPVEPVLSQVKSQKEAFLSTLKELVDIESGSADREGLDRLADLVAAKLRAVGAEVEVLDPAVREVTRFGGEAVRPGRIVRAVLKGAGGRRIFLFAHMDTVYTRGMIASHPFRIEGDRAYGLGVADDKQGVALIIHALAALKAIDFRDYGELTVLFNGDEEIGSNASRKLITETCAAHDACLSFEPSGTRGGLSLATAGIGTVRLKVQGLASHAGASPERGVNALYELAHQILQMRDLSDPATGAKMNWTLAHAGTVANIIPPEAEASADVRVRRVEDYDRIEREIRRRVANQLIPEAKVEVSFTRGRPPLAATPASRALAKHAQSIYGEIGLPLALYDTAGGGGTDAAYAALNAKGPVVESFGLASSGSHSARGEYVLLDTVEPRLYLAARIIMDISRDKVRY